MLMFHQIVQKKRSLQDTFSDRFIFGGRERISEGATIKSAAVFHGVLAKERARVDRNSHVFSLVSFEVGPLDYGTDTTKYFIDQLKKQIRITDEIGWLDSYTVGVLLFNSLSAEASKFIEKIQRIYPHKKFFKYSISCYPESKTDHSDIVERENSCPHSIPDSASFNGHHSATDDKHALSLQPIFFNKTSILKRLCDIVLSILALVVLSPLLLTIAIGVKLTSRGPILFRQQRAGLGGMPFTFLKSGPVFKMANDPRITTLGMFLRRWSLDELPQFINVLKGDMSLVGPRPPTMDEVEKYESWHNYRLEVLPGITCIWQVYARGEKSFENWVRLDIKYKREQSFLLDLKLIALTVPAVFSRRGAS
ncbi:MAG: sugar transferase [Desulfobulbaceae bacterium]